MGGPLRLARLRVGHRRVGADLQCGHKAHATRAARTAAVAARRRLLDHAGADTDKGVSAPSRNRSPMSAAERARTAMGDRLKNLLPPDRAAMITGSRTATLRDNLLPSLTDEQVELASEMLAQGSGKELTSADGTPPSAHSAHSSAAAAINLLGVWLGRSERPVVAGIAGADPGVVFEAKLPFQRGGTPPNLDALLTGPEVVVAIESKLTEMLSPHSPRPWQKSISRPENLSLLGDGWRATLEDAIAGEYHASHLESGQLLRHALGVQRRHGTTPTHLIYAYWEPENPEDFPEIQRHRDEVAEFTKRVGDAAPQLHAVTHRAIIDSWDLPSAPDWLRAHCTAWRARYALTI